MLRREGLEVTDVFPFPSACLMASSHTGAVWGHVWGPVGCRTCAFRRLSLSALMSSSSWFLMPLVRSLPELPRSGCCLVDAVKHQNSCPLTRIILVFHRQRRVGDNWEA